MKKLLPYKLFLPILLFGLAFSLVSIGAIIEEQKGDNLTLDYTFVNDEFGIFGPDELCLYYGSIIGDFSGGGLDTDVFAWRILDESGNVVVEREGAFQIFSYTFSIVGIYTIELNIRRGTNQVFSSSKEIIINPGVDLIIQNSYLICDGGSTELTLIDPGSPDIGDFIIEWKDSNGQVLGNGNKITVNQPGSYTVDFYTTNDDGEVICPYWVGVNVRIPSEFTAQITNRPTGEVCEGFNSINLTAGQGILGEWYYTKDEGERVFMGEGSNFSINSNQLQGDGKYNFIFVVNDFDNKYCKTEDDVSLTVTLQGDYVIESVINSDGCGIDNGSITVRALTDLDRLRLLKAGANPDDRFNINAGDLITFDNLGSGVYTFTSFLGACSRWRTRVVNSLNDPTDFLFDIETIDESCSETGLIEGQIIVKMLNATFTGEYQLFNNLGLIIGDKRGRIENQLEFQIPVNRGNYLIELYDDNGCTYTYKFEEGVSDGIIRVRSVDQVIYNIPNLLNICQSFEFIPETNQNLKFKLTYPDGSVEERNFDQTFLLDQQGEYTILGSLIDEIEGFCPRERTFFVNINDPVPYEPVLVFEDCLGNKEYVAELFSVNPSTVNIRWYNENDELVGSGVRFFPISFGEFKLYVQPINSEACPIPAKVFEVRRPDLELKINYDATTFCPLDPVSTITLTADFTEVDSIAWIFYEGNDIIDLPQFSGLREIEVIQPGPYEVILFSSLGCEIGRKLIEIEKSDNIAEFDIPESLIVCESYSLVPDTNLNIEFIVTNPNGDEFIIQNGDEFILDIEGEYLFESKALDENDPLCRLIKRLNVTIVQPVTFEPELLSEDCEGNLVYTANVFGEDPELLDFYWYAPNGDLISQDQVLQPTIYGEFQLDVRRKGSLECPGQIKSILIEEPVISLDVTLEAQPTTICPDLGFTFISINADLERVEETIKWFYTDAQGNRVERDEFENEPDIVVQDVGLFEVEVYNHIGCLLGSDQVEIQVSVDEVRPFTEEEYVFCLSFGEAPEINPGEFRLYEWYLDGRLVHEESTLRPTEAGEYTLTVTSFEGCRYTTEFTVREVCELQLAYPTAIEHGNPFKNFVIYPNYLVDELSVWVYNKWGQLLYYCTDSALFDKKETCVWDGTFEGQNIPTGTYAVKIQYKNRNEEGYKSVFSSITVLE